MNNKTLLKKAILSGLAFLLFFQLVSDFVETIYTFGLMGTNIPPQIVSLLLFFTPVILLFFKRGFPRWIVGLLLVGAALAHSLEITMNTASKMVVSGLGVGFLLIVFPAWLAQPGESKPDNSGMETGLGLLAGLALSILFRVMGAGTDVSMLNPWISWLLAGILVVLVFFSVRESLADRSVEEITPASPRARLISGFGFMAGLAVLYYGFASPLVLARWSGLDDRLIIGLLAFTLGLYGMALAWGWLVRLSTPAIWIWNAFFLGAGTTAILINQVYFPAVSSAYPIVQPALTLAQQLPLLVMILLSPVALLDLALFSRTIKANQPASGALPEALSGTAGSGVGVAGGFSLGALFLLMIMLSQAFTTVYDYIPVIGPWFRDRFWLVFLVAGLGMALSLLVTRNRFPQIASPSIRRVFFPALVVVLLAAFGWSLVDQPSPVAPAESNGLRVVTYNIQQGYSVDGQRNYLGQLDVIRSLEPDIVGLEESDVARFSGGNADIVRTIADGLGMYSYYGPRTVTGTFGIALLSRYPIENPQTIFMYSTGEQTAAISAQITVNGKKYFILVTHLGNDGPMIQQQEVLSYLAGKTNVIAMGDFNFEPSTPQYALTLSGIPGQTLEDAWLQDGSPLPGGMDPGSLIDHIFVSPGMPVQTVRYEDLPDSDHPVLFMEVNP